MAPALRWLPCTALALVQLSAQAPSPQVTAPSATALDRYVAAPDAHFRFEKIRTLPADGVTADLLQMTSQQWLTTREVDRPVWTHWLTVLRPGRVRSDVALLFVTGGSTDRAAPAKAPGWLAAIARDTGTVVAELRLVPNQPIVFMDDSKRTPRTEDDFIAYTWDKFLRTGDERWPARLPMTKSVVRAMDAITNYCGALTPAPVTVSRFVVSGASKRGWTTWTTAAVDRRVVAIVPAVIDLLNIEPSFVHHWRAYGAWSPAIDDYVRHGIMRWMGTPQFRALMQIEEPYSYRERLTMPKLIVNASGDEFFLPDSSRFYIRDLPGETHLRYVPNTGHGLDETDALATLHAFYASIVANRPRPSYRWSTPEPGLLRVTASEPPGSVRLWTATNPKARDFRIDAVGPAYRAEALAPSGPNTWQARIPRPARGWTAGFIEMTFASGGTHPLKFTTGVQVVPDTLPFPPPAPARPVQEPTR